MLKAARPPREPFVDARWYRDRFGRMELHLVAGGRDIQALDSLVSTAFTRRAAALDRLMGFSGRICIAILPRLTPDTPESRRFRMQLQRRLREEIADAELRLNVRVEYERCA